MAQMELPMLSNEIHSPRLGYDIAVLQILDASVSATKVALMLSSIRFQCLSQS